MKSVKFDSRKNTNAGLVSSPRSPPSMGDTLTRGRGGKAGHKKQSVSESKRRQSTVNRVVTSFRGGVVPEHRGHMPRVGHVALMYNRDFYIFGGYNAKGMYNSHIYRHEKRSLQWEEVRGFGLPPPGRANHSAVLCGTKMITYGGHKELEVLDDMFSFDFETKRWEKIFFEKSQGPGPLFLHTAVYVPTTHSMVVLGGFHQREHNIYLGHVFDIKNKSWNGIPCPSRVNPQQIQTPLAAYYAPSASIIVLGLINMDYNATNPSRSVTNVAGASFAPSERSRSVPKVHIVNTTSWVWTEVLTTSSPESPIPFRMESVWDEFMTRIVQMGGYYDEVQVTWYFPVCLKDIREGTVESLRQAHKRSGYAFLKLDLSDYMWSLVPVTFPKKLLNEMADKNKDLLFQNDRIQRHNSLGAEMERQRSGGTRAANAVLSASLGDSFDSPKNAPGRRGFSPNPTVTKTADGMREQRKRMYLFCVDDDEPQYLHKYAFAAYREETPVALLTNSAAAKPKPVKPKPLQYILMHGGLYPDENYSMLMFTPVVSRVDAHTSRKLSVAESTISLDNSLLKYVADDDDASSIYKSSEIDISNSNVVDEPNAYAPTKQETSEKRETLPGIPGVRTRTNAVAMQYAPANSIQKMDHLLPYPNIPVVVIEEEADVNAWAAEHYKDSRQWVSQKLKEATAEDRAVKRAKRKVSEAMSRPSKVSEKPTEEPRRKTKVGGKKGKRKTKTEKPPAEDTEKEHSLSLDSLSISIPEGLDGNPTDNNKKEDFFKRKALEVYPVDELILPDAEEDIPDARTSVVSRKEIVPAGLERLWMKVKRHTEKQRLPNTIFKHRASVGEGAGVADLGIAMAFVIMRNAIDSLRQDGSAEMRSARAHYRWRFLRTLVRTGEAAFILYRVSQEQAKVKALTVGSVPGLVMAPELSMMGTKRTQKVATRQVPYVLQDDGQHKARQAEITNSGMVVYHNISRKK